MISHHLAHHSADVAAVLLLLLSVTTFRHRAESACGRPLIEAEVRCLSALAFLHDIGKLAPGFQSKGWPDGPNLKPRGHLECGWMWTVLPPRADALAGAVKHLARWADLDRWFEAVFAHHGRPVIPSGRGEAVNAFARVPRYDWVAEETVMGEALLDWFPEIKTAAPPPPSPAFIHFFCGLLTLADWIGSDREAFPYVAEFRKDYWQIAQDRATKRLRAIGLVSGGLILRDRPGWALISDHPHPRPAQDAVGHLPTQERMILLEAETGSGKTEAALLRFAALVAAGEVDALYFAVPTRAAARQLHGRVNEALKRMFDPAPEAVLAIPGQVMAGEAKGTRLPDFGMLWDDSEERPTRWAAEHSARYLAAQVAVGTVDQVALAGLQVKYAHLRGTALSRALLVIDEVHASDAYMTEVQTAMARSHLGLGGHVMLMSATLGAAARRRWFDHPRADLASDAALPYPAIWTSARVRPVTADAGGGKSVQVDAFAGWTGEEAAELANQAARQGARVLVIRNTVERAQATYSACLAEAPEYLLTVSGRPTLHHSRFATEDRARLDAAVEAAIGKSSPMGGRIVIGTQTLEQSLDLCADILITDLCPMDVLLQRIGRLHRHNRLRPAGYDRARVVVLRPPGGLDPMIHRSENGLGASQHGPSLNGIYVDVPGLAATLAEIEERPVWQIPAMNRALVEAATHPEALDRIAEAHGWQSYRQKINGKLLAEARTADLAILDRTEPLGAFPDDEQLRTRLGEDGVVLRLAPGTVGVFGLPITRIALPAFWSQGLTGEEAVEVEAGAPIRMTVGDKDLFYDFGGLRRF
jgi:CRISPR-associated endonuclease/helicase Cas3